MRIAGALALVVTSACTATLGSSGDPDPMPPAVDTAYTLPDRVVVKPVFFVPADQQPPIADDLSLLARHLAWSQQRYQEMLGGRDTFQLDAAAPEIVMGASDLQTYLAADDQGASAIMAELLAHVGRSRFDNPYVFATVVMNAVDGDPAGGGRVCNGGLDGGAGLFVVSSTTLASSHFQSTLQHELGHTFGLVHVDAYGYDMASNASIMSYNLAQWTNGFEPSPTPGILIPEDVRALAMNDRVFPSLAFDPASDIPAGYAIAPAVPMGAMDLPGLPPNEVTATTSSGELYGSSVGNTVQGTIKPSAGPGITFDPATMWHSDTATGEVSMEVTFPFDVTLTEIGVHSQHSALYHAAIAMRVEALAANGDYVQVASQAVAIDDVVGFAATTARTWRLDFTPADGMVVIRGLQFFVDSSHEVFPPFVSAP